MAPGRVFGIMKAAIFLTCVASEGYTQDIKIGLAAPISGPAAVDGRQVRRGVELAVERINSRGGLLGRSLKLEIVDDRCDLRYARGAADELVDRKVVAVIGHVCSDITMAVSQIYQENNILQIIPSYALDSLIDEAAMRLQRGIFRTRGRLDQQSRFAGTWVAKTYKDKRIAILRDQSDHGLALANTTAQTMTATGNAPVMYEIISQEERDFLELISRMKKEKIDVVCYNGTGSFAAIFMKQAFENGFKPQMIGGDDLLASEFWSLAGPSAEGTLVISTFNSSRVRGALAAGFPVIETDLSAAANFLYAYAAVQVWAQAVASAGTTNVEAVSANIYSHNMETVLGTLAFDAKGDVTNYNYVFYIWNNGRFREN